LEPKSNGKKKKKKTTYVLFSLFGKTKEMARR